MPLNHGLMDRLNNGRFNPTAPTPKYGDDIFTGTDYPKTFEGLVGQTTAKEQLLVSIKSARARGTRLDHTLLASGAHGIGKGQPVTSWVLTPTGWRQIGSLKVGDEVIGSDGLPTSVTGVYNRGRLPVYAVRTSDDAEIIVDGDHLWKVRNPKGVWSVQATRDLIGTGPLKGNRPAARGWIIPLVAPVDGYETQDLPIHPYMLGMLLANGHLGGTPALVTNDEELIDNLRVICPDVELHESTSRSSTARRWNVQDYRAALRSLRLHGLRSAEKFIPEEYIFASVDQRRMLLAALVDCDGSVRDSNGQAMYFTSSKHLATGVRELVESLGGTATIRSYDYPNRTGIEYVVAIHLDENPFTLKRKADLWRPGQRNLTRRITSIVAVGEEDVRCIQVAAEDQLYVTERYVVTHNTTLAQIVAYQMGAGFVRVSGALTVDDGRTILTGLADGDILFWDEFHLAVHGSKAKAEWLLPWMADGVLMTKRGAEPMPDVTLLAATTDAGRLPQTIISRFMIRPRLVYYTVEEGALIAANLADRMRVKLRGKQVFERVSRAANANPREMRMILTAVRDLATLGGPIDLNKAFDWAGVTYDGLTTECQEILLVLLGSAANTASLETIQAALGEPGPMRHHEQLLIQKGLLVVTGRGRSLTDEGVDRARALLLERAS